MTCLWSCPPESNQLCIRIWGLHSGRVPAGPRGRHDPHWWHRHQTCYAGRLVSDSTKPASVVSMGKFTIFQRSQALGALIQCQRAPSQRVSMALRFLILNLRDDVLRFAWRPKYRVSQLVNFNAVNLQIIKSDWFALTFNSRKSKHELFHYLEMHLWSLQDSDHAR